MELSAPSTQMDNPRRRSAGSDQGAQLKRLRNAPGWQKLRHGAAPSSLFLRIGRRINESALREIWTTRGREWFRRF